MIKISYSTKIIFNSDEDRQKIIQMLEAERFCWNECSKVQFGLIKNSIVDLHAEFYHKFRESQPQIPSTIVIETENSVLSSYRAIKSKKEKVKEPAQKNKLSIRLNNTLYSYKKQIFSIIALGPRVKCKIHVYPKLKELLEKYNFCDPLLFVKNNEVWMKITFNVLETLSKQTLALGIDLGCRINAATSEGKLYVDKKFNGRKRQLRHLKRQLQSKAAKGSKSAQLHLEKLRGKERNLNKNFTHNLTKKIITETKADVLAIENLKSIKVKKNKYKNNNRISQVPFYQFKEFLTYKAPMYGKTVIEVSPLYSSLTDWKTGKQDGVRRGRRYYASSGQIYDSDINGAINIGLRSKLPVSLGNAETYGQASVVTPIVGYLSLQLTK